MDFEKVSFKRTLYGTETLWMIYFIHKSQNYLDF